MDHHGHEFTRVGENPLCARVTGPRIATISSSGEICLEKMLFRSEEPWALYSMHVCRSFSWRPQRTITQVSRAFCAILVQNAGIVRKTYRTEGKTCHTHDAYGCDVQGRLVLRRSSRQVVVAEEEFLGTDKMRGLLDLAFESMVKDQGPDREMRWNVGNTYPGITFL